MSKERKDQVQVSVKFDREMWLSVERLAHAEHRTPSGQVRHIVASAIEAQMKRAGHEQG
jgi:hypothetical protein